MSLNPEKPQELRVMSNDNKIAEYRKQVEDKHNKLGPKPKKVFSTNGIIYLADGSVNLNLLSTPEKCIDLLLDLAVLEIANKQVNTWLARKDPLMMKGYSIEQYVSDVKCMLSLTMWEQEKKKLTDMNNKLTDLLSNEGKTAEAISYIGSDLGLD